MWGGCELVGGFGRGVVGVGRLVGNVVGIEVGQEDERGRGWSFWWLMVMVCGVVVV